MKQTPLAEHIGLLLEYQALESHFYTLQLFRDMYEKQFTLMVAKGQMTRHEFSDIISVLFEIEVDITEEIIKQNLTAYTDTITNK
jgi:hypothetical protein